MYSFICFILGISAPNISLKDSTDTIWGLSHYSPPPWKYSPPHYGIIIMIGGAIGYLTTRLGGGGGYNRKDPQFVQHPIVSLPPLLVQGAPFYEATKIMVH